MSTIIVALMYKKCGRKNRKRDGPTETLAPEVVEQPIERGVAAQPLNRLEGALSRSRTLLFGSF
ncbi:MAG: hypothetical protein ABIS92_05145 [Polyangia bacterium]